MVSKREAYEGHAGRASALECRAWPLEASSVPLLYHVHNVGIGWGGWLLMSLITVAFWVLAISVIVLIARGFRRMPPGRPPLPYGPPPLGHPGAPDAEAPEAVLAQRFARGEIDQAEYRARLVTLREGRGPGTPTPTA